MRLAFLPGLALSLAIPALTLAGPFEREHVAADAKWMLHMDFEALEDAEALEELYQERVSDHQFVRSLEEGRWDVNIDFEADVRGVTLYGKQLSQLQGVLLLYMETGSGQESEMTPNLPGYDVIPYEGHRLHTWSWPEEETPQGQNQPKGQDKRNASKGQKEEATLAMAFPKEDMIVWAGNVELLKWAIDVLDGRAENLNATESFLAEHSPPGTVFLVRAAGMGDTDIAKDMPWVEQIKGFAYAEGLQNGKWFSRFAADTGTPQVNTHVKSVVDGVVSAFWLMFGQEGQPEAKSQEGPQMTVSVDRGIVKLRAEGSVQELANEFEDLWQWMNEEPEKDRKEEKLASRPEKPELPPKPEPKSPEKPESKSTDESEAKSVDEPVRQQPDYSELKPGEPIKLRPLKKNPKN